VVCGLWSQQASVCLAVLLSIFVLSSLASAGEAEVGVGQAQIALPPGVPLAGYSRRHGQPSTGVHDPVGVRALVFRDEEETSRILG
jgi:hypothetical protein